MALVSRVIRGYTFISREYDVGDAIHIVGFSRGAYTARALGGMISKVGLLNRSAYDASDKDKAYRLGLAAWAKAKGVSLTGTGKLTGAAQAILNLIEHFMAEQIPND
ncbi:MAG: hypothetical protein QOK44_5523, partial [Betaproteobacteria bacterium]|nr:hypothetical protein [Betaproteobacteria bacterium]